MNLSDLRPGRVRRTVTVLAALAVGALPLVPAASADVTPATVEATLSPVSRSR